jgi:hypothetical protein
MILSILVIKKRMSIFGLRCFGHDIYALSVILMSVMIMLSVMMIFGDDDFR